MPLDDDFGRERRAMWKDTVQIALFLRQPRILVPWAGFAEINMEHHLRVPYFLYQTCHTEGV